MTLKVIAAALALLPMLAGAIHHARELAQPIEATVPLERAASLEPTAAKLPTAGGAQNARSVNREVPVAGQQDSAESLVPKPKVLLLLGLALLCLGLGRGGKQDRNRP